MTEELMKRSLQKYGADMQVEVLIEECAELIQVLQKHKRMKAGTPNADVTEADIISECVDVGLLLEQMKLVFPRPELWNTLLMKKVERLARRLNDPGRRNI